MKKYIFWRWVVVLLFIFWFTIGMLITTAMADDDRHNPAGDISIDGTVNTQVVNDINNATTNSLNSANTMNNTGGDVSFSSRAFGFSHSLGDVDINDCLASTQWATIIISRQTVLLNKWCAAEVYDAKGLHVMAGAVRCEIPEINKLFPSNEECRTANTIVPPPPMPVAVADNNHVEQQQVDELKDYNAQLQARVEAMEERLNRPAPARPAPQIVQQQFLGAEKRAKLAELRSEDEENGH